MPDTTTYHLVFDAVSGFRPGTYGYEALGALAVGGVVFLLFWVLRQQRWRGVPLWLVGSLAVVPAASYGFALALSYSEMTKLREALKNGRFTSVEGIVTGLQPGDSHRSESFEVAGHLYKYSFSSRSAAFNQDAAVGGPIRDGLRVRITDVEGKIARLEIAQ